MKVLTREGKLAAFLQANGIAATVEAVWNEETDGDVLLGVPDSEGRNLRVQVFGEGYALNSDILDADGELEAVVHHGLLYRTHAQVLAAVRKATV